MDVWSTDRNTSFDRVNRRTNHFDLVRVRSALASAVVDLDHRISASCVDLDSVVETSGISIFAVRTNHIHHVAYINRLILTSGDGLWWVTIDLMFFPTDRVGATSVLLGVYDTHLYY
jgi:hypothetical protein